MLGDTMIVSLLKDGRLRADTVAGLVFAPRSNTPEKPVGAMTRKGYLRVCINVRGRQHHFMAHRIVWVAAHGPLAAGLQIDHGPGGKSDNRLANLEAVTGEENMRRAVRDGKFANVGRRDSVRDGKGRFGRLLDGQTYDAMPRSQA